MRLPGFATDAPPSEPNRLRRWLHGAFFDNLGLKFLSMVLAITVFLLVNTDRDRESITYVPVKYEYPADKVLVSDELREVRVTVKGPARRLRQLGPIQRIDLDVSKTPTGEVEITPDMIKLPPGLAVTSISPRTVRVAFDKRIQKIVEVEPVTTGRPQHGRKVASMRALPATVKVHGGERLLDAIPAIHTEEISLDKRTESFEVEVELAPPDGVTPDTSPKIAVRVEIQDEYKQVRLAAQPVAIRGDGVDPAKWTVAPAQVEITVMGRLVDVEGVQKALTPYVRVGATEAKARDADVLVDGVPPGVVLGIGISSSRVKLTPARP